MLSWRWEFSISIFSANVKIPTLQLAGSCNSCDAIGGEEVEPPLIAINLLIVLFHQLYTQHPINQNYSSYSELIPVCFYLFIPLLIFLLTCIYLLLVISLFNFIWFPQTIVIIFLMFWNVA